MSNPRELRPQPNRDVEDTPRTFIGFRAQLTFGGNVVNTSIKHILSVSILILGVFLIVLGIWQGELLAIMQKAIVICLECIGIG